MINRNLRWRRQQPKEEEKELQCVLNAHLNSVCPHADDQEDEEDVSVGELATETQCQPADASQTASESSRIVNSGASDTNGRKEKFVLYRRNERGDDELVSEDDASVGSGGADSSQQRGLVGTVTSILESAVRHIAGEDSLVDLPSSALQAESLFEDAMGQQYL